MCYQRDRDEFIGVIVDETWSRHKGRKGSLGDAIVLARLILRNATTCQKIAVKATGVSLTDYNRKQSSNSRQRIVDACKPWGIKPTFNGDPRGAVVKLILPSGRWNSAGGAECGYCVPIR